MSFLHVALLGQCTGRTQVSRGYCIVPLHRQYLCHVVLYPFSADVLTYNVVLINRYWQYKECGNVLIHPPLKILKIPLDYGR